MSTSETIAALSAALAKAQGEMQNATLNQENPHFKSKYADLASIRDATIPALSKNGLAMIQYTSLSDEGRMVLHTRLSHSSGEWVESLYPLPVDKPQVMGSALTYGKRYCWAAMCGISADEDDDGNAAQEAPVQKGPAKKASKVQPKPAEEPPKVEAPDEPGQIPVPNHPNARDRWKAWCEALSDKLSQAQTPEEAHAWIDANQPALKNLRACGPDDGGVANGDKWADTVEARAAKRMQEVSEAPVQKPEDDAVASNAADNSSPV